MRITSPIYWNQKKEGQPLGASKSLSVQLLFHGQGVLRFLGVEFGRITDGKPLAHRAQAQWWSRRINGQNGKKCFYQALGV